jgi:Rieske 2Fe-2S family protein
MRITPINASSTDVEFCWLVDGKAEEGKDYQLEHLTAFWEITGDQDGQLCENNFKGIESNAYKPGPYGPTEDQVINFVDWCVTQLQSK